MEQVFGYWWHPDQPTLKVAGRLVWEPPSAPRLTLLEPPFGSASSPESSREQEFFERVIGQEHNDMLHGFVEGMGAVTLISVAWAGWRFGIASTHSAVVDKAVVGQMWLDQADEEVVKRVLVQWPALGLLLGPHSALDVRAIPRGRSSRF